MHFGQKYGEIKRNRHILGFREVKLASMTPFLLCRNGEKAGVLFTVLYRNKECPKAHGRRDLN